MRLVRRWLEVAVVASVLTIVTAPVLADSVAIVTDLSGKASIHDKSATILSEIEADARVRLEAGARLVAIYLRSGEEYTFSGPAQIQFRSNAPQVLSGANPQKRANPLAKAGKDITIKPLGVTQAGFIMRSGGTSARIRLLTLSGTNTLDTSPEFRWFADEPGLKYRFELTDDAGKSVYEANISGTSLRLPDSVRLRDGATYTWEIATRLSNGRRSLGASDFRIVSADMRAQAEALRPVAAASVSARVVYAAWLEQMELKDEARKYWKALSAERPEDARLKGLAGD